MPKANYLLDDLRAHTDRADALNPAVSEWSVGMHIEHCAAATKAICKALINSRPPAPPTRFSAFRALVFWTGRMPRGKGRAPKSVHPSGTAGGEDLRALLNESAKYVDEASRLEAEAWFKHFVFGVLTREKALQFIRIHNDHHLRIIADITRSTQR